MSCLLIVFPLLTLTIGAGKLAGALSTWSLKMSPLAGSTMGLQLQVNTTFNFGSHFSAS